MRDIWLVSDTHFFHKNILQFTIKKNGKEVPLRPQWYVPPDKWMDEGLVRYNLDLMNDYMRDQWNSVVKDGDIVYHLGDVTMPNAEFGQFWATLRGAKRLVLGNHDDAKLLHGYFKKIYLERIFREFNIQLSHIPLHPGSIKPGCVNVHGHIHDSEVMTMTGAPDFRYYCVCVERTDYRPVHIEEVRKILDDREGKGDRLPHGFVVP